MLILTDLYNIILIILKCSKKRLNLIMQNEASYVINRAYFTYLFVPIRSSTSSEHIYLTFTISTSNIDTNCTGSQILYSLPPGQLHCSNAHIKLKSIFLVEQLKKAS